MRIISVNVNGIQAAAERGLLSWLQAQNADVICLQDTRASAFDLDDPSFQLTATSFMPAMPSYPNRAVSHSTAVCSPKL